LHHRTNVEKSDSAHPVLKYFKLIVPTSEDDRLAFLRFDLLLNRYFCNQKESSEGVTDSRQVVTEACWKEFILERLLKSAEESGRIQAFVLDLFGMIHSLVTLFSHFVGELPETGDLSHVKLKFFFSFITMALVYWCDGEVLVKLKLFFSQHSNFLKGPRIHVSFVANLLANVRDYSETNFSTVGMNSFLKLFVVRFVISLFFSHFLTLVFYFLFTVIICVLLLVDCFMECEGLVSTIVREMRFNTDWYNIRLCMWIVIYRLI
jgi:hypothetical protein